MSSPTNTPRVLMLSDVYFPRINGVSTSIQTFRRDLGTLGWPTRLLAPRYPSAWQDDADTRRVSSRSVPLDPEDRLMAIGALRREARDLAQGVEMIHIQTPFLAHSVGVSLARELGIRTVETYHTFFEQYFHHYAPFLPRSVLSWAARRLSKIQCNAVDTIISPSAPMADVLQAYGIDTPIEVIPTGLDLSRFDGGNPDRFRNSLGIDSNRPMVLHVGRVAYEKNIEFLIDSFALVRQSIANALLIIAGEGPAREALSRKVRALGLASDVLFVGYLDRDTALVDAYKCADVFVFASNTETQGLVILEAMAAGTPVVSTAVLGTKDVLAKGPSGAVVVPEDRETFGAAILRVLDDVALQTTLSTAGRRYVYTHWSSRTMAERTIQLYERLLGRCGETPVPTPAPRRRLSPTAP